MSAKKGLVGSTALALALALGLGNVASASPPLPGPSQPSIRPVAPAPEGGYWVSISAAPKGRKQGFRFSRYLTCEDSACCERSCRCYC